MAAGFVFGIGIGGVGVVWDTFRKKTIDTMPTAEKLVYDHALQKYLADGLDVTAAEALALDAVAMTDGGRAHIEGVVNELKALVESLPELVQNIEAATPTEEETDSGPFILGTREDSEGNVISFEMADPETGDTFTAGAVLSEDADGSPRFVPDPESLREYMASRPMVDDIDSIVDSVVKGGEDIDALVNRLFGKEETATFVLEQSSEVGGTYQRIVGHQRRSKRVT